MVRVLSFSATVTIFIILSLTISLLPTSTVEVILPNETTEYVYNIYSRKVTIESNFVVPVTLNISRIDLHSNQIIPIEINLVFEQEITLDFNEPGYYLFQILSPELIQLTFNDSGFRRPLLLIAVLLIILKGVLWLWDANLLIINPQRL